MAAIIFYEFRWQAERRNLMRISPISTPVNRPLLNSIKILFIGMATVEVCSY